MRLPSPSRCEWGSTEHTVFKEVGAFAALRQLAKAHAMIVQDTVHIQNRFKAIFRSQALSVTSKSLFTKDDHEGGL